MKLLTLFLMSFLIITIILKAQVQVKYSGYRQAEPTIAAHPNNYNILATAVIEYPPSGGQLIVSVSTNSGSTWNLKKTVANAADPVIEFDNSGSIFFSYLSKSDFEIYITKSTDLGQSWSTEIQVSDAVGVSQADKEWIAIDKYTNYIYLIWAEYGQADKLMFSRSTDGGTIFSQPDELVSEDGIFSPFILTGNGGKIFVAYAILNNFNQSDETFDLKLAKSTNYGQTFTISTITTNLNAPGYFRESANQEKYVLKYEETSGERSFRIHPVPSMTINNQNGYIYTVVNFRENKNHPIGYTDKDNSDLILYRSTNDGTNWTQHRLLDWEENGADLFLNDGDQFFPSITCSEIGNIYCLFYNSLDDYNNLYTKMSVVFSSDNGESFGIINADSEYFDPSKGSSIAYNFIGDYIQIKNTPDEIAYAYTKTTPTDPYHILYYHSINLNNNITVYNDVNSNNTLGNIYVDGIQHTNLPQTMPLYLNYHSIESPNLVNEWKFYKWQSVLDPIINGSRIKNENFVAEITKTINSKFEQTKPLTVRNYLEGGDGGTIQFGEITLPGDFIDRNSPFYENAFLYDDENVPAIYRAQAYQTIQDFYGTNWNFIKWEDGSIPSIREEQVSESTAPEWRAKYKGNLRSDDSNGISSGSQRKLVRTDNGIYHLVYESMGEVWYTHSLTGSFQGAWSAEYSINEGSGQAKNPSIDYEGNAVKIVMEYYDPLYSSNAAIFLMTWEPGTGGTYVITDWEDITGTGYSSTYFGSAKPVIAYNYGVVFIAYRKNSTGGIYQKTKWENSGTWQWGSEILIPNTTLNSSDPSVAGHLYWIHMAYRHGLEIKHLQGYRSSNSWVWQYHQVISEGSGYSNNHSPSMSLAFYTTPIVSWIGYSLGDDGGGGINKIDGEDLTIPKVVVRRRDYYGNWGSFFKAGYNVVSTNNNSSRNASAEETIITWSEGTAPNYTSKWVRRVNGSYTDEHAISHNGKQNQVSNGSNPDNMKGIIFSTDNLPYILNLSPTNFNQVFGSGGGINKISDLITLSYGREGVIYKNGVEFLFNIGDIIVGDSVIKFIEQPDTILYSSAEELNSVVKTVPFYLSPSTEFYFTDFYYVLNDSLADTALTANDIVNFKVELVKEQTGQVVGTFDNITYTKEYLDKYANVSYQVNCSNISPGDYYLRLVTTTEGSSEYFLCNVQNSGEGLDKRKYTQINFDGTTLPVAYSLEQNYPNPFNPSTTIRYQIPKEGMVTLKVYDILGAEVVTLVNEEKAAGKYVVNFDANRLASGVYLYKLQADEFVSVKKMVLVK